MHRRHTHAVKHARPLLPFALLALVAIASVNVRAQGSGAAAQVAPTVARLFAASVAPATEFKPYFLTGDFNGDGQADLAALVHVKTKSGVAAGVTRLNPWGYEGQGSTGASDLALAIVHGPAGGWTADGPPAGRYLLADRDFFSTPIWEAHDGALISLARKPAARGGRRAAAMRTPRADSINLATEAGIDLRLYWTGKTYKIDEPNEEP